MPVRADADPAAEAEGGSARAALVIAVDTYVDKGLRQLRAPAEDASTFGDVLGDPDLGGFDVTSLLNGTAHQMRLAIAEFLTDRRPEDVALVYLSCHGLVDVRRRLYFAANDTLKDRLSATGVEAHWLLDGDDGRPGGVSLPRGRADAGLAAQGAGGRAPRATVDAPVQQVLACADRAGTLPGSRGDGRPRRE